VKILNGEEYEIWELLPGKELEVQVAVRSLKDGLKSGKSLFVVD
jgi:hypothetical protein